MADISSFRINVLSPVLESDLSSPSHEVPSSQKFIFSCENEPVLELNSLSHDLESTLDQNNLDGVDNTKKGIISRLGFSNSKKKKKQRLPTATDGWLLRLFESTLFDTSLALAYLYSSKEQGVIDYITNRLFTLPDVELIFYAPQLIACYIGLSQARDGLEAFFIAKARSSMDWALLIVCLLRSLFDSSTPHHLEKILSSEKRTHQRTASEATGRHGGYQCKCSSPCSCLGPQLIFINELLSIGRNLQRLGTRELRTSRLSAELAAINVNLPARVWFPGCSHVILHLPPAAAVVLNSKERAPFFVYAEAIGVENRNTSTIPNKPSSRRSRSAENLSLTPLNEFSTITDNEWVIGDLGGSLLDKCPISGDASPTNNVPGVLISAKEIRSRLANDVAVASKQSSPHSNIPRDPEDPSASALREPWAVKAARVKSMSGYGSLPGWMLSGMIVKVGDDLKADLLAYQLLKVLQTIWKQERVPLKLRPVRIYLTGKDSGLVEPIPNAVSLHHIKKQSDSPTLLQYLVSVHGPVTSENFLQAQQNFLASCAAYSLACYLLEVKDRHNGNILLDDHAHLIHIDFGFMLSNSPRNLGFETSPFKLTNEFVEVMGGDDSDLFAYYKILILQGLIAARKHSEKLVQLVEILSLCGHMKNGAAALTGFKKRFLHGITEEQLQQIVDRMVDNSRHSITTRLYDGFQYLTNGIL